MWTVQYREYLEFDGVKANLQQVKYRKKQEKNLASMKVGMQVEQAISKILGDNEGLTIKVLPPQMDHGFGADIQVSYSKGGKQYSFYADITSARKPTTHYLTIQGGTTRDFNEAFCYNTEYFNMYFGFKESHMSHFFYEKPVVVLYIEGFIPCTGLAVSHINNIGHILQSLNGLLMDMGYGARASQKVKPNIKKHIEEYKEYKKQGGKVK